MNYEEAMATLGTIMHFEIDSGPRGEKYREALRMGIEALRKEIETEIFMKKFLNILPQDPEFNKEYFKEVYGEYES